MATTAPTSTHQTTARIVGAIYLAGFVVGIGGDRLIQSILGAPNHLALLSANSMTLAVGALLWLTAVVGDAAHGVLMFPLLKAHSERIAVGYLAARIMDAIFIAIMVLFILLQIPLGSEYLRAAAADRFLLETLSTLSAQGQFYAYTIGMGTLGVSGVMLCTTLYRARLVARPLAVWGLVGYTIILCGMASDLLGSGLGLASSIPGGLWELFVGVWLVVKGFNTPVVAATPATTDVNAREQMSLSQG